jgi:hypothetical protein
LDDVCYFDAHNKVESNFNQILMTLQQEKRVGLVRQANV